MAASVTTKELLDYCRADDSAEVRANIEALADAAEAYLLSMGVAWVPMSHLAPVYALAVKALTLHWFDNPDGGRLTPNLKMMVEQLITIYGIEYA